MDNSWPLALPAFSTLWTPFANISTSTTYGAAVRPRGGLGHDKGVLAGSTRAGHRRHRTPGLMAYAPPSGSRGQRGLLRARLGPAERIGALAPAGPGESGPRRYPRPRLSGARYRRI